MMFLIALFASACASEGLPNSYADQDKRAENQFVEACKASLDGTDQADVDEYCQCAFFTIAANKSFAEFIELDDKLKDDSGNLSNDDRALLEGVSLPCQFDRGDIDTSIVES